MEEGRKGNMKEGRTKGSPPHIEYGSFQLPPSINDVLLHHACVAARKEEGLYPSFLPFEGRRESLSEGREDDVKERRTISFVPSLKEGGNHVPKGGRTTWRTEGRTDYVSRLLTNGRLLLCEHER